MSIKKLRKKYHKKIFDELLRFRKNKIKGDYPNNADGNSRISVGIAKEIIYQIGFEPKYGEISGQRVGNIFERITKEFIEDAFTLLSHIRPGNWIYSLRTKISNYDQYKDLADIEKVISGNRQLAATLGKDYIITPDIVIAREPVSDDEINKDKKIVNDKDFFADLTPLRESNYRFPRVNPGPLPLQIHVNLTTTSDATYASPCYGLLIHPREIPWISVFERSNYPKEPYTTRDGQDFKRLMFFICEAPKISNSSGVYKLVTVVIN